MKEVLFNITAQLGKWIIIGIHELGQLIIFGVEAVSNFFVWVFGNIFAAVLSLIDRERVEHAEHVAEQQPLAMELEILGAVTHVKEDAIEKKKWTEQHSIALNILGNRLLNECDWEEQRIHDYMRRVVESIPGLGYLVGSDDDDDSISIEN